MNNDFLDSRPLPSTLFGPTQNDIILVEMLNKMPLTKRRRIIALIMEFTERINILLQIPPTSGRMRHALHFVELEYAHAVENLRKRVPDDEDLYMRVLGAIRARRKSVGHRLVNSMKMLSYKELLGLLDGISDKDVLAVYPYGSRVYGTSKPMSDYDFIIITKNITRDTLGLSNHVHATIYSLKDYMQRLEDHEISILECMSLPKEMMVKSLIHPQLKEINLEKLRHSISGKSSNSLVKANKKLKLYDDRQSHYIGLKSMFHSLRMIRFGIQIATHGKIVDYGECNELYDQMLNETLDWDFLFAKYKPYHNAWMTEFRELAPKTLKS